MSRNDLYLSSFYLVKVTHIYSFTLKINRKTFNMYTFILKLYNYAIAPKTFTTIFFKGGGGN